MEAAETLALVAGHVDEELLLRRIGMPASYPIR